MRRIELTDEQAERLRRFAIDEAMNAKYAPPYRGRAEDTDLWEAIAEQLQKEQDRAAD